jgi:hypothetical protein
MNFRVAWILAVFIAGVVAAPSLKASTVTFTYAGEDVGSTTVSGSGSFSYNGSLATIGLGNLTAFNFELDLSTPATSPNPVIFDFTLVPDLLTFSATVSGGDITALSLSTDFEGAANTDNFDETQKDLVINSLGTGGADVQTDETDLTRIVAYDTGTITTQGPGAPTPEPSTALLTGGAALLLFLRRRNAQAPRA